jgi:hypothetical protein|tara:strand:+ start:12884 stop:13183 length:300 start_codon:yes stop_codon:yes gene_type:complete
MIENRSIFLWVFVGLLAMSAVQFFMLEVDDLTSISATEEQQETFSTTFEVQALDFDEPRFHLFTDHATEVFLEKYYIIHVNKNYSPIYLAVPYFPPELS